MQDTTYSLSRTLKRMLRNAWGENRGLFGRALCYMLVAGIYPFFAVLLPKLLIGVLEHDMSQTSGNRVMSSSGAVWPAWQLAESEGIKTVLSRCLDRISNWLEWTGIGSGRSRVLVQILIIVTVYFLIAGLFAFLRKYLHDRDYNVVSRLRLNCLAANFQHMLTMDYKYREDARFLDQYEMASVATRRNDNGVEGIYHKLYDLPSQVLSIVILAVLAGKANPLILLGLAVNIGVGMWVQKQVNAYQYSKREVLGKAERRSFYYYNTTYDFSFGKEIRLFGFEKRVIENYNLEIERYVNILRLIENRAFALGVLALGAALISDVLTYGCLIYEVLHGMSIADFSMYLSAVLSLATLLAAFSESVTFIHREGQYVSEYFRFQDADLGIKGGKKEALVDTLEIEFRNVTFRYPGTEKDIFKNLNFMIHHGEKLAIVGINGAGKSTLVKLITGLFEPTEGEILVNGIPQKEFNRQEYFKMFSVVFQDIVPVAFTIGENVACMAKNIDSARLWDCLDRVGLGEKVRGFERGTDQMLLKIIDENGTQLSGGEAQKLMIARALYKDANMVILDEPTAALDALAEAEIYQDFDELVSGKTAVYISHRLSSTKFCDHIALFDDNGLAEYGSHEELMAQKGAYYHMFSVQGKYYRTKEEKAGEKEKTELEKEIGNAIGNNIESDKESNIGLGVNA